MALIPEHVLDEIQSRADIAELIGRYVPLKRAGRHFKAVCPFHKERTPSFHVNTDKQIFHCFGCGVGGNIFTFLVQHDRLTFPDAVRQVAQQVGVAIPEEPSHGRDAQTQRVYEILEKACAYYERQLAHPAHGRGARDYLASRGITDGTRQAFRLGYAPDGPDALLQAATRSGASGELLEQAGLVVQGRRGPVDRFRQRLLFPIVDVRGRVIAFGARSLANQDPKYLNSPQTPVYHKGRQLFGLVQAKEAIVREKSAVVVEGYFDVAWLWQAGIRHAVSPSGTAFTPDQAKLLSRYTPRVILAFDADAAGAAATVRGIETLLEAGLDVQVAELPAGLDPDEFVRREGAEAFRAALDRSLSVVECLIAQAGARHNVRDPEGKVRAVQSILTIIAKAPNAMLRAEYARIIADRFALDEQAVLQELSKAGARRDAAPAPNQAAGRVPAGSRPTLQAQGAERMLAALVLDAPSSWERAGGQVALDDITDPALQNVLAALCEMRAAGHAEPTPAQLISRLAASQEPSAGRDLPEQLVSELVALAQSVSAKDAALRESVRRIAEAAQKRRLAQVTEQIRTAQRLGQDQEVNRLLTAHQQLRKRG